MCLFFLFFSTWRWRVSSPAFHFYFRGDNVGVSSDIPHRASIFHLFALSLSLSASVLVVCLVSLVRVMLTPTDDTSLRHFRPTRTRRPSTHRGRVHPPTRSSCRKTQRQSCRRASCATCDAPLPLPHASCCTIRPPGTPRHHHS